MTVVMTEKEWQAQVVQLARLNGWRLIYHTFDSRHSKAGFPDLVLLRPPELLIVELKTDIGKVKADQQEWLDALAACGVETAVWRPCDFDLVLERLRRK